MMWPGDMDMNLLVKIEKPPPANDIFCLVTISMKIILYEHCSREISALPQDGKNKHLGM